MTTQNKRTTIYLDPALHKALRLKAVSVSKSTKIRHLISRILF
jgi:hypothetical protein